MEGSPKTMTKTGVIEFLRKNGAGDLMNTAEVAILLKRDTQSIRRYVKKGALPCEMKLYNRAIYKIEDVADFILANPQIALWPRHTFMPSKENIEMIRRIIFKNWEVFAKEYGIDDLASEVLVRMAKTTRTGDSKEELAAAIQRVIYKIYIKFRKQPKTVSLDERMSVNAEDEV